MSNSLLDQLKKTGLVDEQQAKRGLKDQRKLAKQQRNSKTRLADEGKQHVQHQQADKVKRDRELDQQRQQTAEQKAIQAQIKQLIEMNRLTEYEGDIAHNFSDKKVVQKIYVSEAVHKQLSRGRVAIVKTGGKYELVPTVVAEKIHLRDEGCIIKRGEPQQSDEDDLYADYKVPDDLMW
ncbi:Nucleoprotein/polynucleotide-associated enzyme [hydrothermal vent metagenome]|uniref:Nucleoprotein/polynucleotide-associated enzyme n=1 Tax=hydrothermal vent metagenome TaxID=652676 RepID=A0A3B1AXH2_9ZZZZ